MKIRHLISACLLSLPLLTTAAEITINNNTSSFGVAQIGDICSGMLGDDGIIKPNDSKKIPQIVFDYFCNGTCEAKLFFSKNCNGQPFAIATIDTHKGILAVQNNQPDLYKIVNTDTTVTIDPVKKYFW